jgi:hypothetical protein
MKDPSPVRSDHHWGFLSLFQPRRISLWLIFGFAIGWVSIALFNGVNAQSAVYLDRFDPDVHPAIDVGHTPPVLVRADEPVRLEFRFACGYELPNLQSYHPNTTLFAT